MKKIPISEVELALHVAFALASGFGESSKPWRLADDAGKPA